MLVSHQKRFIYTKTAKTAGSSVEAYFESYCLPPEPYEFSLPREQHEGPTGIVGFRGGTLEDAMRRRWYNHMNADIIKAQLGDSVWTEYFKFCVIRDPYDMMVSAFHYQEHRTGVPAAPGNDPIERFRAWIATGAIVTNRGRYVIEGQPCMDYHIRYEELECGIRHVCEHLNIPFVADKIPRIHKGIRPGGFQLRDYYDASTAEKVASAYEFEFDFFGYPTEVGAPPACKS